MHVRFSQVRGTPVVDDSTQFMLGVLTDPLIHPDTGRIEGFFVAGSAEELFLSCHDIVAWGMQVHIKNADKLGPPSDFIRLQKLLEDPRTFLGQLIRTEETRRTLGVCTDVQFDTRHFIVEWLFPRRFFLIRQPIPASDVGEVTPEAIWVKDPLRPMKEKIAEKPVEQVGLSEVLPTQTAE